MRRIEGYQIALLSCAGLVVALTAAFVFRELRPEYKNYQKGYVALEKFRAEESGEPPPPYKMGVKQILIQEQTVGPERVDRCISCHTTLNLPHFSPTRPAYDLNGNLRRDAEGRPLLVENREYVFRQLNEKIARLRAEGKEPEASRLEKLRYRKINGREVDLASVLMAHPLIGQEVRPFEYHPVEEYGCTSCHSGNGRSLREERAHGPVFDGHYPIDSHSALSPFVEVDSSGDPRFAQVFNAKPGHDLLFQTSPLLIGGLMEARCLECHRFPKEQIEEAAAPAKLLLNRKQRELDSIQAGLKCNREALIALLSARDASQREDLITEITGSQESTQELIAQTVDFPHSLTEVVDNWLATQPATEQLSKVRLLVERMEMAIQPLALLANDDSFAREIADSAGRLLGEAERGQELFMTQACYGCHRIDGLSRGQVGPDLTEIGLTYPWYVKLSLVWPQGKLPSSAMPNFKLDHDEVEDLMAFLMAQTNRQKAVSAVDREVQIARWEAGQPMPWERPIAPSKIANLDFGMRLFATEGCASCHKLHGFTSNVHYRTNERMESSLWFRRLIPEEMSGQEIAERVHQHAREIDEKIGIEGQKELLDNLEPQLVESYYTQFKVAARTDNSADYRERLNRVLKTYIQEYGLGREIGPKLSWSGLFRDDEWLMGHFRTPSVYSAKSIMPAMPFDDSKFRALNFTLRELARRNREALHALWEIDGYQPALAYQHLCSSCHGTHRQGDGVIAQWIYPIPKNLRNATFLRNLTKEEAIESITHGVKGTPMPPWGESIEGQPVLSRAQIEQLVDWLYASLPGQTVVDGEGGVQKWQLTLEGVIEQLCTEERVASTPISFDTVQNGGYIKRLHYTPANIEAGRLLFLDNCAHCHGPEGGGNGLRAERMVDAKPRMLTNLSWIQGRDDLRLLRSIQFGVPGTSMTPWGDQTSTLQRLQLVMYIRTLSEEKEARARLNSLLYHRFDHSVWETEQARMESSKKIEETRSDYEKAARSSQHLYAEARAGRATPEMAAAACQQEIALMQQLSALEKRDEIAVQLIKEIRHEKEIYSALGQQLIGARYGEEILDSFFGLIDRSCDEGLLLSHLDSKIGGWQRRLEQLGGKIREASVEEEKRLLLAEIRKATELKTNIVKQLHGH
jgi:mono/diheme cytochrome c family protein